MDPALKQRLIGAAVLVALAVIFLPMMLGGPSPTPSRGTEVPLSIPAAPDRPLTTREIPLGLPPAAPSPDPSAASSDRVVTVDADVVERIDAEPERGDGPAADSVDEPAATPPSSRQGTAPVAVASTASAASASPSATPTPPPPAAPATPAPANGSRFVVNLGSYAARGNADALRERLQQAGLTVYSENISLAGKPALRLRAGPYASRGEAEAARQTAQRVESGLSASVLTLAASELPAAPARPAVAPGFAVQVGALKSNQEAIVLRDRLRSAGFAAYTERADTDAGPLWRVRAGPELKRERADALREEIRRKLQIDGLVVGHP
jgi:DedD protein